MRGLVSKCCQDVLNLLLTRRGSPMGGRWRQLINQLVPDCHIYGDNDKEDEHFNDDNDNNEDGDAKEETDNEDEDANQERGCCQLADPLISPSLLIEATIHLVQELYRHYTLTNFDRRDFSAIFQFCNNKVCECVSFLKISSALLFLLRCLPRRPFLLRGITQRTLRTFPHF